jgi:hypothetical protein
MMQYTADADCTAMVEPSSAEELGITLSDDLLVCATLAQD